MGKETWKKDVGLLQKMVQIPSVTGSEHQIADFLEEDFRQAGMQTRKVMTEEGQPLILGILQGKKEGPVLVFNGHTDTHPVQNYRGDPYSAHIQDGKLFGRGSVDMKGGLAAMACGAKRLAGRGLEAGTLIVAAVPDEEFLSRGTTCLVAYLKGQGIRADAGIVGEPTRLQIGRAMRGVSHIDITVTGYPGHTSGRNHGGNAILQMGRVLGALEQDITKRYEGRSHPLLGAPVFNVGLIQGGEKPNVVAQHCRATLLRRDLPGEDLEQVLEELRASAASVVDDTCQVSVQESEVQKRPGKRRLPMEVEPESKVIKALARAGRAVGGSGLKAGMVPYWCDASIMANEGGIPTVVFGPGDIACAHSPKEWIDLDQYQKAIEIYANMAWGFLHESC